MSPSWSRHWPQPSRSRQPAGVSLQAISQCLVANLHVTSAASRRCWHHMHGPTDITLCPASSISRRVLYTGSSGLLPALRSWPAHHEHGMSTTSCGSHSGKQARTQEAAALRTVPPRCILCVLCESCACAALPLAADGAVGALAIDVCGQARSEVLACVADNSRNCLTFSSSCICAGLASPGHKPETDHGLTKWRNKRSS